ncbi:GPW/gp25 family protein [Gynuella sp.]|uniref:GPW/gp25 family protein n=1 Tax=Gynuella sp. TaxID=2969146 RepID=UPI003D0C87FF
MKGMNAQTGKPIEGLEHLRQSVQDILATPVGSRVMRRNYGSRIMQLLDNPVNAALIPQLQAAVVEALGNYEPRLRLNRVLVSGLNDGELNITIEGFYVPDSRAVRLENITVK